MIDIVHASELGEPYRRSIVGVFADGFGPDFRHLSRDRERLADAFAHMLDLDLFWGAMVDGEPAGITALTNGQQLVVTPDSNELRRHLGLFRGTIAVVSFALSSRRPCMSRWLTIAPLSSSSPPRNVSRASASARPFCPHLLTLPRYTTYYLEAVADTNSAALHLYRKLGFTEYKSVGQPHLVEWHQRLCFTQARLTVKTLKATARTPPSMR